MFSFLRRSKPLKLKENPDDHFKIIKGCNTRDYHNRKAARVYHVLSHLEDLTRNNDFYVQQANQNLEHWKAQAQLPKSPPSLAPSASPTSAIAAPPSFSLPSGLRIRFFKGTSTQVALELTRELGKTVAILNMANAYQLGGGYLFGEAAQEEFLCRTSNMIFQICSKPTNQLLRDARQPRSPSSEHTIRSALNQKIATCMTYPWGMIQQYQPKISAQINGQTKACLYEGPFVCMREGEDPNKPLDEAYHLSPLETCFPFYTIVSAALDLNHEGDSDVHRNADLQKIYDLCREIEEEQGRALTREENDRKKECIQEALKKPQLRTLFSTELKKRIRAQLNAAAQNGQRNLVLGAFGCGAFSNPPELVAQAYCEILSTEFIGAFDNVDFGIFDIHGSNNYDIFVSIFQTLFSQRALTSAAASMPAMAAPIPPEACSMYLGAASIPLAIIPMPAPRRLSAAASPSPYTMPMPSLPVEAHSGAVVPTAVPADIQFQVLSYRADTRAWFQQPSMVVANHFHPPVSLTPGKPAPQPLQIAIRLVSPNKDTIEELLFFFASLGIPISRHRSDPNVLCINQAAPENNGLFRLESRCICLRCPSAETTRKIITLLGWTNEPSIQQRDNLIYFSSINFPLELSNETAKCSVQSHYDAKLLAEASEYIRGQTYRPSYCNCQRMGIGIEQLSLTLIKKGGFFESDQYFCNHCQTNVLVSNGRIPRN